MLRNAARLALLMTFVSAGAAAQDANAVVGNASKAMGADNSTSITYSGSAAERGNFGQSKTIAAPWAPARSRRSRTTRARSTLSQPASRAFGTDAAAGDSGRAGRRRPGTFNQNITPANTAWTQQLEIWVTPWGFLKGAAANNATSARSAGGRTFTVVSWSPAHEGAVRTGLHGHRLHQRPEPGGERRDAGSSTPWPVTCSSKPRTPTTRISAA